MLCAIPALRALRTALPAAHITFVGLPWAESFSRRFSRYIDAFIEFSGFPGVPERSTSPTEMIDGLRPLQSEHFDLAIQLHGSGSHVNDFVALMGANQMAAFHLGGDYVTSDGHFIPWPTVGTEVERLLLLMTTMGAPDCGDQLEFPLSPSDLDEARTTLRSHRVAGSYACIHPGARFPSRRWGHRRFAAVGDQLAKLGYQVVVTGTNDEKALIRDVIDSMHHPPVDLAGAVSLGGLAAILSDANLLVANDTGVSHVASAVRTPSVIIASGSDPYRWRPQDIVRHQYLWHDVPCRPCNFFDCPLDGHPCAAGVTVEDVLSAVQRSFEITKR